MSAGSPRAACRSGLRARLLQGASAVAFVAAVGAADAQAQSIANLRAAANVANAAAAASAPPRPTNRPTAVPGMSSAQVRGLMYQARVQAGVDLATQAQQAARASAQALNPGIPN